VPLNFPRARKRFGQHFLHDPHVIARIIAAIGLNQGDAAVEIGPGQGALTAQLLAAAGALTAIEIDRDLAQILRARFAAQPQFELLEMDALRVNWHELAAARGARLRLIGNLPYNISTPLLFRVLESSDAIADMHFMLQKEVVDRIVAAPGSKTYPAWAASPLYARVVAAAFGQRRKTLRNALQNLLSAPQIEAAGIDPGARAETLSADQFGALALAAAAVLH